MKTTFKIPKSPANARKLLKLKSFVKTLNFDNIQEYIELSRQLDFDVEYEHHLIHQNLIDYNNHCVFFCKNNNTRKALIDYFKEPQQVALLTNNTKTIDCWKSLNFEFTIVNDVNKLQKYPHVIIDDMPLIHSEEYKKLYYEKLSVISLVNYDKVRLETWNSNNNVLTIHDNILWQYVLHQQKSHYGKQHYLYLDNRKIISNNHFSIKEKADLLSFHGFLDLDVVFEEIHLTLEELKILIRSKKNKSIIMGQIYSDDDLKTRLNKIKKITSTENPEIIIVQKGYDYDKEILKSLPVYILD